MVPGANRWGLCIIILLAVSSVEAVAYDDARGQPILIVPVCGPLPGVRPVDIDGDRMAWVAYDGKHVGNASVHVLNATTGEEKTLSRRPQETAYCSGRRAVTPGISGDRVVWTESMGTALYVVSLTSGEELVLVRGEGHRGRVVPQKDGLPRIVWETVSGDDPVCLFTPADLHGWDTVHGERFIQFPAIEGDRVVWAENAGTSPDARDISLYNLTSHALVPVCTAPGEQTRPRISGDRVVWQDMRNGNWDIYCYDLTTGEEHAICTDPGRQMHPDIHGDDIVWQDRRTVSAGRDRDWSNDIRHLDLATGRERAIATGPGERQDAAVDDGRAVWVERGGEGSRLLVQDLAAGTTRRIPVGDGSVRDPVISGTRIAVCGSREPGESWSVSLFETGNHRPDPIPSDPAGTVETGTVAAPGFTVRAAGAVLALSICLHRKGGIR